MTLSEPFFDRSWQSHQVTYHKSLQIAIVTKIGLKHNTFFKVLRGFRGRWVPSRMFSKAWDGNNNRVQVLARERERERESATAHSDRYCAADPSFLTFFGCNWCATWPTASEGIVDTQLLRWSNALQHKSSTRIATDR